MTTAIAPSVTLDPLSDGVAGGFSTIADQVIGPGPRVTTPSAYEGRAITRTLMTAEYEGRVLVIKDSMEDYTMTSEQQFYTQVFMPFFRTDEIHMQWSEWQTKTQFMGPTPHLASSRVLSRSRVIRKASMARIGLVHEFEDDNLKTPGGRASFNAALVCTSRSFIETCNVHVMRALRSCHQTDAAYVREYALLPLENLEEHLNRDKARFMIVQKEERGIQKMNTIADQEQRLTGGTANAWIGGEELSIYCEVIDPNTTTYRLGGQEAVDRLNGRQVGPGASGGTMASPVTSVPARFTIQGQPFYISKSYHVDKIGQSDLLSRIRECGVFNLMVDRTTDFDNYHSAGRNIRIYNNFTDAWSVITLHDAIEYMPIWGADGKVKPFAAGDDDDFLSFRNGTNRSPIRFVGDMSPNHIKAQHFLDGGRTLLRALANYDDTETRAVYTAFGTAAGDTGPYEERLGALVGNDNTFRDRMPATLKAAGRVTNDWIEQLKNAGKVVRTNAAGVALESSINHDNWLRMTIAAPFPDQHKAQAERIIRESAHLDWAERAKQLKNFIVENRPDFSHFAKDAAYVDQWFSSRIASRQEAVDKHLAKQTSAPVQAAAEYVPSGLPVAHTMSAFQRVGSVVSATPGSLRAPYGPGEPVADPTALPTGYANFDPRWTNMAHNLQAIHEESAHPAIKFFAMLYAGIAFTKKRLQGLIGARIKCPLGALLCRPHATYKTRYAIKAATGGQTGFTMFGHSDLSIGHDSATKKGFFHYTVYTAAVVVNPRNVVVMADVYCAKYMGGMDATFYKNPAHYEASRVLRSASILSFPLPPTVKEMDKDIDIRGKWYTHQKQGFVSAERYERPMYPGSARMVAEWKFQTHNATAHSRVGEVPVNYTCSQGMEWYYSPKTDSWNDFTPEQSVFGHKVYPGCGRVRNGELTFLKDPGYGTGV